MIEKTVIISGASDDNRAHIIGIYAERIQHEDQKIFRLVATDGSRLSKADYIFDKDTNIIPIFYFAAFILSRNKKTHNVQSAKTKTICVPRKAKNTLAMSLRLINILGK